MPLVVTDLVGARFVEGAPGEPLLRKAQDAIEIVSECFSAGVTRALLYAENLTPRFFDLSSGQAGEIHDKLRRYRVRLAIVCETSAVEFSRRLHEILADDLQVFETREAAAAWLAG